MVMQCGKYGMEPVCDHRNYCKADPDALYIGQTHHISYKPHRLNNNYMPAGFSAIQSNWQGLCVYTANANGNHALCNLPGNSHSWRHPGQYNPGFVCGKVVSSTTAILNSQNVSITLAIFRVSRSKIC